MKTRGQSRGRAGAGMTVALVVALSAGCGRIAESETESIVGPSGKHDSAADEGPRSTKDASTSEDGASPPVGTCDPSSCALRESICLDDSTMRWFTSSCSDAGACEYTPYDMTCQPSGLAPSCFQGGCRVVVLR